MTDAADHPVSHGRSTAILRTESTRHLKSAAVLLVVLLLFTVLYLSMFPNIRDEAEDLTEAFPDFVFDMFGIEAMHTIEGFIGAELYSFFWALFVAAYFGYLGAAMVAVDVDERRMDLLLANPISRESVLLQKVAALWAPLVLLNVAIAVVVYAGSVLVAEPINPVAVAMVHLLSVPYLLVCAGIGVVLSVHIHRPRTSRTATIALITGLWLVDAVSRLSPAFEWVGGLTPSRYYDHTAILVHEEYAIVDAVVLLVAFAVLLAVATVLFVRRDI